MEKNYNLTEYAIGSTKNRHHFKKLEDVVPSHYFNNPLYKSHFIHSEELTNYYNSHTDDNGNKTLKEYDGTVGVSNITIDIDDSDLQNSLNKTRELLTALESNYGVDLSSVRVNLSGSKGFHIRIPSHLFDGFEPSQNLNTVIKGIALELSNRVCKIDESVYNKTGLIRVVNSKNKKSGLFAVPLTKEEVFELKIDEIKELAVSPRDVTYPDINTFLPIPKLVELKEKLLKDTKITVPVMDLYEPKEPGERHASLLQIVGKLIAAKIDEEHIYQTAELWNKQNLPAKPEKEFRNEVTGLIKDFGNLRGEYWLIRRNKKGMQADVNPDDLLQYLEKQGFGKVYFGKVYDFIRIHKNIAEITVPPKIKDFIMQDINESAKRPEHVKALREEIRCNIGRLFNENLLETMNTKEIKIKQDTKESSFIYYKNGIVELNKGSNAKLNSYDTLDQPIWNSQLIARDIKVSNAKYKRSEFELLIRNMVRNDEDRLMSICSAIGYVLHKYKNKSEAKAIIFMDEKVTENPVGRTGKSLIGKGISQVRKETRIDGKNFEFKPQFTFQQVTTQTEFVDFNDVKKDFDFEMLFSVITDDMTIEYKNENAFAIPFSESPKIIVSTNYTINGMGDSFRDRMFEIEISDYYNAQHKPTDDFGHLLFDDWDEEEWNRFDNFMIECLELYLEEGLIEYRRINIDEKKLLLQTSREFVDFMNSEFSYDIEYDKEILYEKFRGYLGYDSGLFNNCPVKKNTFTKYLIAHADFNNFELQNRNSNGKQYIRISKVKK